MTRTLANASVETALMSRVVALIASRTLLVTIVINALRITGILPIRPVVSLVTVMIEVRLSFNENIIFFSSQVPAPSSVTRQLANASVSQTLLVTSVPNALRITGLIMTMIMILRPKRWFVSLVTVILKVRLCFNENIILDAFTSPGRFLLPEV